MTNTIINIEDEEKDKIQREVLEFFSREQYGATTAKLSKEPGMVKRKKDKTWNAVKHIIYSMRNLGLLSDTNSFTGTRGKVYELSEKGKIYYEELKRAESV